MIGTVAGFIFMLSTSFDHGVNRIIPSDNSWEIKKFPKSKTMPQVVIDNKHIGGYNDLEKWLAFRSFDENF